MDPAHLRELVLSYAAENESLRATIQTLKGMVFGSRSEKLDRAASEQLQLAFADVEIPATPPAPANDDRGASPGPRKERAKPKRNIGALPKHLPVVEDILDPPSTACPCCTGLLHRIGADVTNELDVVPAILRILRTVRPKYACRSCEGPVVQAKARPRLIGNGMVSTALVAWIAAAKFAWGSTLYRQVQMLAGHGVIIGRETLARWMKQMAWWLKPVYELQLSLMHKQPVLFCDETPMPVIDPGRGKVKRCQFWSHATDGRTWQGPAPPAIAYVFAATRKKIEIATQLADFSGVLQVDAYAAYKALAKDDKRKPGKIRLAFCLTHARRKFVAVLKATNSPFAREVVEQIAAVYAIEKRIRGSTAQNRQAVRQAETKPLMSALKASLVAAKDGMPVKSTLTKAINYTLAHWDGLIVFLEDGRLEPDTNIVERSIRPIGIGRRNSLFCGDAGGGETWAILASLVNTAKLNGADPQTYLTDILERIVSGQTKSHQLHELLVWNWKAAREAGSEKAAA